MAESDVQVAHTHGEIRRPRGITKSIYVGQQRGERGEAFYVFHIIRGTFQPVIYSFFSRKWWTITWEELVKLAQEAGVDREEVKE